VGALNTCQADLCDWTTDGRLLFLSNSFHFVLDVNNN